MCVWHPLRTYAANTVLFRWDRGDVTYLAQPRTVHTMDLATATYDALHVETEFTAHTNGLCHGLAGWFTMRLGERWLSTAPMLKRHTGPRRCSPRPAARTDERRHHQCATRSCSVRRLDLERRVIHRPTASLDHARHAVSGRRAQASRLRLSALDHRRRR